MWQRLDESKLRNTGGSGEFDIVRRCYGKDGKSWPRITMAVLKGFNGGVKVSLAIKDKAGDWWGDSFDLPPELLPEMADMLQEAYRVGRQLVTVRD